MRRAFAFAALLALLAGAGAASDIVLPAAPGDADFAPVDPAQVALGQMLFYDPILSGNRNIACATCHHPDFGTSDGVALSLGEGGIGLGPGRRADPANRPEQHIPRNAPALFNLGARGFDVMFHDGRIEVDPDKPGGLRTPLGADMSAGFASLLSAQTMFPVLSPDEMAGHYSENDVARAVRQGRITGPGGAWDILARRVAQVPGYTPLIRAAFPDQPPQALSFNDISDAIAAFVAFEWRADNSSFDAHLRGQAPLRGAAARGMALFYGAARCSVCHAGAFQTDHRFHAMAVPQFGPGKAARFESHNHDTGRMRVTGRAADAYAFRTPSLRNVRHTGPYGHTGSHADLAGFVADHLDPVAALHRFDAAAVPLAPLEGARGAVPASEIQRIADAVQAPAVRLQPGDLQDIVAFLDSLSDPGSLAGRLGVPDGVPSGLAMDRR
ncbi:MAG: cytochrome-c peroxidase [Rhodobacteraceae bacterium]|nr:cytochrome-c peroxidase [Paracoccaceae bacterium]